MTPTPPIPEGMPAARELAHEECARRGLCSFGDLRLDGEKYGHSEPCDAAAAAIDARDRATALRHEAEVEKLRQANADEHEECHRQHGEELARVRREALEEAAKLCETDWTCEHHVNDGNGLIVWCRRPECKLAARIRSLTIPGGAPENVRGECNGCRSVHEDVCPLYRGPEK